VESGELSWLLNDFINFPFSDISRRARENVYVGDGNLATDRGQCFSVVVNYT
jgi:hypothetical protein